MLERRAIKTLSVVMALGLGCDSQAPVSPSNETPAFAPADGNGNKFVIPIHVESPEVCPGGTELDLVIDGWFQGRFFVQANNNNVQLNVFRITWTFTNSSSGETFAFQEVGPDRVYLKDGKLFVAITGRIPFLASLDTPCSICPPTLPLRCSPLGGISAIFCSLPARILPSRMLQGPDDRGPSF